MNKKQLLPLILLLLTTLFITILPVEANLSIETEQQITTFSNADQFISLSLNSSVSFVLEGSYTSLEEKNGTLNFHGLVLANYLLNFSDPQLDIVKGIVRGRDVLNYSRNEGDFSIAVQDCNITIQNYDILARFVPKHGWLNYTVNGTGIQSFNLHYTSTAFQPLNWTVYINDEIIPSELWSITSDGWLTVSSSNSNISIYYEMINPPKDEITPVPLDIVTIGTISVIALLIALAFVIIILKKKQVFIPK
ncbi:MAG: hypothetical protein QM398_01095 [Thermoproteota archaeon]|nr:hypothetical protein [Thermoproteota archaeon]NLD67158.1 hypothetical protein [Thermoproteota archaeon]